MPRRRINHDALTLEELERHAKIAQIKANQRWWIVLLAAILTASAAIGAAFITSRQNNPSPASTSATSATLERPHIMSPRPQERSFEPSPNPADGHASGNPPAAKVQPFELSSLPVPPPTANDVAIKAALLGPLAQLKLGMSSGEEGDRVETLKKFLRDGPPDHKHSALKLAFASGDPELQSIAIKTAIDAGGQLPVVVPDDAPASGLASVLRALHVRTGAVNADTGKFDSGFIAGAYGKLAYG